MKVNNINNKIQHSCKCGSFLQHWRNNSKQGRSICAANNCLRTDIVGALVTEQHSQDSNCYIVPFCNLHMRAKTPVQLVAGVNLVAVNTGKKCS